MRKGILGKKLGMTQLLREDGTAVVVTLVEAGPCFVLKKRAEETDGYSAVQLAFDSVREGTVDKPRRGEFEKVGVKPCRFVREIRGMDTEVEPGGEIKADIFTPGDEVDISGISKGRGYSGAVKRHGFGGFSATHGTHESFRGVGSTGMRYPQHTRPGLRGPGQYGNVRKTVKNLKVIEVDVEENVIFVKGAVPGPIGGYLEIVKIESDGKKNG